MVPMQTTMKPRMQELAQSFSKWHAKSHTWNGIMGPTHHSPSFSFLHKYGNKYTKTVLNLSE